MKKKLNILVDGYNLSLKKGSGIKTYGMTLLDAYASMGYDVGVLLENKFVTGKVSLLDEVNLFDQDEIKPLQLFNYKWYQRLKSASYLIRNRKGHMVVPKITEPNPENYLSNVAGKKYQYIENSADVSMRTTSRWSRAVISLVFSLLPAV